MKPPGAVILFDGKNLDQWEIDKHWKLWTARWWWIRRNRIAAAASRRRRASGDYALHVEFWLPLMADQVGQARANSGVFLAGRYEVQILDTLGHPPEDNGAGGIYKVARPG